MFGEQRDRGAVIYKSKIYYIHSEFGKKKQLGSVLESFRDGYFSSRNVFPLKSKVSSVCVWRFTGDINRKKIAFNALLC